jgi:integrase
LRNVPVKKGFCRLCWCQARLERSAALGGAAGTYTLLLPYVRQVRYQQLFLAGMPAPRDLYPKPELRRWGVGSGKGRLPKPSPAPAAQPVVPWWQPPLFDGVVREYRYGRVDLRRDRLPDNPWLAWALHIAHTMAEARGFDSIVLSALNRALVMLLANHVDGERIRFSDFHQVLRRRGTAPQHTAHVLSVMGILIDDRRPAINVWLDNRLACLAPAIGHHTHRWARALLDGQPRSKPRNPLTVRNYIIGVQPILADWSTRYDHLREITRDDVVAAITSLQGHQRQRAGTALRSLFGWANKNGIVFRNPTTRIRIGKPEYAIPQPLTAEQIAPTIQAAHSLHARVAIALAAIHAARHTEIRNLQLGDIDLGNRRLRIAGKDRPMDDLTYRVLHDWLDHRGRRWPNTANPHLLLSRESALRLGPVSLPWLNRILCGLPATLERLRVDRQLDEAIASGADPLQVAEVFGVCETTAVRYATAARQLLGTSIERQTEVHDEPPDTLTLDPPNEPLGSR